VLCRVTELVVEFSSSVYMTDTQLSRLKRIPGKEVFRQTINVCGFGSQEDDVEYASKHHNVATMASTANVIASEIIEKSLEKIES